MDRTMKLLLVIVLALLLVGSIPAWPYSTGWGWYPSGGLGALLLIALLVLVVENAPRTPAPRV